MPDNNQRPEPDDFQPTHRNGKPDKISQVILRVLAALKSKNRSPALSYLLEGITLAESDPNGQHLMMHVRTNLEKPPLGLISCCVSSVFMDQYKGKPKDNGQANRCLPGAKNGEARTERLYIPKKGKEDLVMRQFLLRHQEFPLLMSKKKLTTAKV